MGGLHTPVFRFAGKTDWLAKVIRETQVGGGALVRTKVHSPSKLLVVNDEATHQLIDLRSDHRGNENFPCRISLESSALVDDMAHVLQIHFRGYMSAKRILSVVSGNQYEWG